MELPLVNQEYILQKFPGKGGWTYAELPEIPQKKSFPFGWVRVKGRIDAYAFEKYHLMPLGNGHLFLPVKAAIRKNIKKEAGDWVTIVLYPDDAPWEISQELEECLQSEPEAYARFLVLKDGEKKDFADWIYAAKTEETKVERIVKTIELLLQGETLRGRKIGNKPQ